MSDSSRPLDSGPKPLLPPKVATGIHGLDEILEGGVPSGRTTLVRGGPGTGKTVIALEFLYRGALAGDPGIFVSFEESAFTLRQNAQALAWDLEQQEQNGRLILLSPDLPEHLVKSGDFDIAGLLAILDGHIAETGAKRIVIDASDVLLRLFRSVEERENQLIRLYQWLAKQGQTAILTMKLPVSEADFHERHEYMADCVLHLDSRVTGQVATRRLRVIKYRGSSFISNEVPCLIAPGGVKLMPISRSRLQTKDLGKVSTGNSELDTMLQGGFDRGTCVLVAGSTGTGKSILAAAFATAACERGERLLYVNFEEGMQSFVRAMRSPGFDLNAPQQDGKLQIVAELPEAMGSEEHLLRLFQHIEEFPPDHVVVDAISACQRLGSEEIAFDFVVRLLNHCRTRGITCVYLNQIEPDRSTHWISGVGISSLVDALIVLEQKWPGAEHLRRLLIIKHRGNRHSHGYRRFRITDQGIRIDENDAASQPVEEVKR